MNQFTHLGIDLGIGGDRPDAERPAGRSGVRWLIPKVTEVACWSSLRCGHRASSMRKAPRHCRSTSRQQHQRHRDHHGNQSAIGLHRPPRILYRSATQAEKRKTQICSIGAVARSPHVGAPFAVPWRPLSRLRTGPPSFDGHRVGSGSETTSPCHAHHHLRDDGCSPTLFSGGLGANIEDLGLSLILEGPQCSVH